jgi:DNA-binding Lrp family transcriptional regulator
MTSAHQTTAKRKHLDLVQKWQVAQHWAQQNPPLKRATYAVLMRLLDRQNPKTGRCDPSAAGLAEETGFTERSVRSAFSELEERGAIKRFRKARCARNQFMIFSVDELGHAARLAECKLLAGGRKGLNPVSAIPEACFRSNVKRLSPETRKETKKKKENAEKMKAFGSAVDGVSQRAASVEMDLGQFEKRVAKVFEKEGFGYEGLLSLPTGDLEEAFARMAAGDLGFAGAVGQLLDKYKALREQG